MNNKFSSVLMVLFLMVLLCAKQGTASECECKCSNDTSKHLPQPPATAPTPEPSAAPSGTVKNCWEAHSSSTACHPQIRAFLNRNRPISIICCTLFIEIHEDCSTPVPHYYRKVYEHCSHRKRAWSSSTPKLCRISLSVCVFFFLFGCFRPFGRVN